MTLTKEGEFIVVLLATLEDFGDQTPSKREVEQHIENRGYLNLKLSPKLLESYGKSAARPSSGSKKANRR